MEVNRFIKGLDRLMLVPKENNKLERRKTLNKLIDLDGSVSIQDRSFNIKWYTRFVYYYLFHFILFLTFMLLIVFSD